MNEHPKSEAAPQSSEGIKPLPGWIEKKRSEAKKAEEAAARKLTEGLTEGKEILKEKLGVENNPEMEDLKKRLDEGKDILKKTLNPEDYGADEKQAS